jgi:periplasmic divalent cation tolerance protein
MNTETGVVMATFPDTASAAAVLDGLLESRLAACVQTMPIQSAYRWKGAVNRETEVLALIKTRVALYPEVEVFIKSRHPYETPEIVLMDIAAGFAGYLQWIGDETKRD